MNISMNMNIQNNKQFQNVVYNIVNESNQQMLSRRTKGCNDKSNYLFCLFGYSNNTNNCNSNYITYYNQNNSGIVPGVSTWQGMCEYKNNQIVICGTTLPSPQTGLGLIYIGNIQCNDPNQSYYTFLVPNSEFTSCYGPRYDITTDTFTLVGSYNNPNDTNTYGFLFSGNLNGLTNPSNYVTQMQVTPNQYPITFVHSTDGNFAVGASGTTKPPTLSSWIYNISQNTYTSYSFNNSLFTTLYGIVLNPDSTYTIVGGYSDGTVLPFTYGFIADMIYDTNTNSLSFVNSTSLSLDNTITHFEGISKTNNPNVYTIAADVLDSNNITVGYALIIQRENGVFKIMKATNVDFNCTAKNIGGVTSSNSVLGNTLVGFNESLNSKSSFQCVIDWNQVNNYNN